jgi:hypothetical protein
MNSYITAPMEYQGLKFEVSRQKAGWYIKARFPTGMIMKSFEPTAMEANAWIKDITNAYAQGKGEAKP